MCVVQLLLLIFGLGLMFRGRLHLGRIVVGKPYATIAGGCLAAPVVLSGAILVGSWLFAHAGYLDADAHDYFARTGESWVRGDYSFLLQPHSILGYHGWWKSERRRAKLKKRLALLGLNGLVFGHDPEALGAKATIAMDADGWFTKLDTGLKENASRGMMLRCELSRMLRSGLLMMSDAGKPACRALTPDGSLREITVD